MMKKETGERRFSVKYRYIPESVLRYQRDLGVPERKIRKMGHIESMTVEAANKAHAKIKFHAWFKKMAPDVQDYRKITDVKLTKRGH